MSVRSVAIDESAQLYVVQCSDTNLGYVLISHKALLAIDLTNVSILDELVKTKSIETVFILNTHHHFDHTSGTASLMQFCHQNKLNVVFYKRPFGTAELSRNDVIKQTQTLREQIKIESPVDNEPQTLGKTGIQLIVHTVPGHTVDHVAYEIRFAGRRTNTDDPISALFVGDILFYAGCGRLFEGSAEQFSESVVKLYKRCLESKPMLYYGHDYAKQNIAFSEKIAPDFYIRAMGYLQDRKMLERTGFNSFEDEFEVNPFLYAIVNNCNKDNSILPYTFAQLRSAKDTF